MAFSMAVAARDVNFSGLLIHHNQIWVSSTITLTSPSHPDILAQKGPHIAGLPLEAPQEASRGWAGMKQFGPPEYYDR